MMQESSPAQNTAPKKSWSLKTFDIYQKIDDNYKVQTSSGATLTILGWVVIFLLTFVELRNYVTPRYQEHMVVDMTIGEQLQINVNITFHALTCDDAHLDVMDVAGDNQLNVEHEMIKQRLSKDGVPIGKAGLEIIGEGKVQLEELPADYCGSCYGAETPMRKCCNTCDELVRAYQEHQWSIVNIVRNSSQCQRDRQQHFTANLSPDEGCLITGSMKVNKVAGNFHIAHGESVVRDGKHIHHFNPQTASSFNISHTIHGLSFGPPIAGSSTARSTSPSTSSTLHNPLDSVVKIIPAGNATGLYQYFIKVIPTIYREAKRAQYAGYTAYAHYATPSKNNKNTDDDYLYTAQYTYSDRFRPFVMPKMDGSDKPGEAVLPGIFFVFEISPFMLEMSSSHMPSFHFLTKLCAIVGGTFTVLGVVDMMLYRLQRMVRGAAAAGGGKGIKL